MSEGSFHDVRNIPYVIIGSGGGFFKTGRMVTLPSNVPNNHLLTSVLHALGMTSVTGSAIRSTPATSTPRSGRSRRGQIVRAGAVVTLIGVGCGDAVTATAPVASRLTAGAGHTCAVDRHGAASCWGSNVDGQLGDGTETAALVPRSVPGLSGVRQIAAGSYHSCALAADGAVSCWGWNVGGQVGDGTNKNRLDAGSVDGLPSHRGHRHRQLSQLRGVRPTALGLCWGQNDVGQLGNGSQINSGNAGRSVLAARVRPRWRRRDVTAAPSSPTERSSAGAETIRASSATARRARTCFPSRCPESPTRSRSWRASTTRARCARPATSRAGEQTSTGSSATARHIDQPQRRSTSPALPRRGRELAAGYNHTCAILDGGRVRCWGWNAAGQLGDGTTTDSPTPVVVAGPGTGHDDRRWRVPHLRGDVGRRRSSCWGSNDSSQLGDGTSTDRRTPVRVEGDRSVNDRPDQTQLRCAIAGIVAASATLAVSLARLRGE